MWIGQLIRYFDQTSISPLASRHTASKEKLGHNVNRFVILEIINTSFEGQYEFPEEPVLEANQFKI